MSLISEFNEQYGCAVYERGVDFGGAPVYRGDSVILPSGRKMSRDAWRTEVAQGRKDKRQAWKDGEKSRASAKIARYMRGKAVELQKQYKNRPEPEPESRPEKHGGLKSLGRKAFYGFGKLQDTIIKGDEKAREYIRKKAPELKKKAGDAAYKVFCKAGVAVGKPIYKAYARHQQNKADRLERETAAKEARDNARAEDAIRRTHRKAERDSRRADALAVKNRHYAGVQLFEGGADEGLRTAFHAFNQGRRAAGGGIGRGIGMAAKTLVNQDARNITRTNQAGVELNRENDKRANYAGAAAAKQKLAGARAYNKLWTAQNKQQYAMNAMQRDTEIANQTADMKNQRQQAQDTLMQARNPDRFRKVQQGRDIKAAKQQAADAAHQQRVQGIASGAIKTGFAGFLDKHSAANRHARAMEKGQRGLERDELNYNRAMYKNMTKMANPAYRLKMLKKANQQSGGGYGNRGIMQSFMQGYRGQ